MKYGFIFLFIFSTMILNGQDDFARFQWEKRVIVVTSDTQGSAMMKKQIFAIGAQDEAFEDRKLVLLTRVNPSVPFEVRLIGLDGGVKLQQNKILSREKLFSIIDGMPMRKREMKKTNK